MTIYDQLTFGYRKIKSMSDEMGRFRADSYYSRCLDVVHKRAQTAEEKLAIRRLPAPGAILGLSLSGSLPLVPGLSWTIKGQFQCTDSRYLSFLVIGKDSARTHVIKGFVLSIHDASRIPIHNHSSFIADARNASLVWEYESPDTEPVKSPSGLHVHRPAVAEWRDYPKPMPSTPTPDTVADVLDDAIASIAEPDRFWDRLSPSLP